MTTPYIEVLIARDGTTKLQTHGFDGRSCLDADRFLRDSLGVISTEQRTREFYQQSQESTATENANSGGDL